MPLTRRAPDPTYAEAREAADELLEVLDGLAKDVRRARQYAYALPTLRAERDVPREGQESLKVADGAHAVSRSIDRLEAACLDVMTQLARYRAHIRREVDRPAPDLRMLSLDRH